MCASPNMLNNTFRRLYSLYLIFAFIHVENVAACFVQRRKANLVKKVQRDRAQCSIYENFAVDCYQFGLNFTHICDFYLHLHYCRFEKVKQKNQLYVDITYIYCNDMKPILLANSSPKIYS